MARKKFNKQPKRLGSNKAQASLAGSKHRRFRWWWLGIALGIIAAGLIIGQVALKRGAGVSNSQVGVKRSTGISGGQSVNPNAVLADYGSGDTAWDRSWPPLPASGEPGRPIEVVRAMYAYAARRPDVLQYMPCYCGCERQGHRSNRDCFVRSKTAAGVPQWDAMGYT